MTLIESLMLGINTTVICMSIVFIVLIVLSLVIAAQTKLLGLLSGKEEKPEKDDALQTEEAVVDRKGMTSGETVVVGVEDKETLAIIMAVVSREVDIPLSELRFKAIKAL